MQLPIAIGPLVLALLLLSSVLSLTGFGLLAGARFGRASEARPWGVGFLWAAAVVVVLIFAVFVGSGDPR